MNEVINNDAPFKISLKSARVNKGLSQKEASAMIGVSAVTIGHYESGVTKPNSETIAKMEEVYGIPYKYLDF